MVGLICLQFSEAYGGVGSSTLFTIRGITMQEQPKRACTRMLDDLGRWPGMRLEGALYEKTES